MLFFSGHGWVVLALWLGVFVGSLFFFKNFKLDSPLYRSPWPEIICAAINIVGCAIFGWWLNRGRPRRIFEFVPYPLPATGHTFSFVRVEYCGLFSILFYGYCLLIGGVFH
jgi:hypothetical protein